MTKSQPKNIADYGVSILGKENGMSLKTAFTLDHNDVQKINSRIRKVLAVNEESRVAGMRRLERDNL
jgi:hypothetical protein